MRQFLAPLVLVPFVAFTAWILADTGFVGFMGAALSDAPGQQVFLDLALMCLMFAGFMYRDAKERGVVFWPWLLLTLVAGSIGPLAYFTYTGWIGREQPAKTPSL